MDDYHIDRKGLYYRNCPFLDTFRYENTMKVYRHPLQKSLYPRVKLYGKVKYKIRSSELV